jgi:hypothetical protein
MIDTPCIETEIPRQMQHRGGVTKSCYVWAAEDWFGPVPEGMQVNHRCDNAKCYNVQHLYVGTQGDNMRDMVRRGRQKGAFPKGSAHPASKLTREMVEEIRAKYMMGHRQAEIAEHYGIHQVTVSEIVTRKIWNWI